MTSTGGVNGTPPPADAARALRVLFVEDSADDAALLLRVLHKAGYAVEWLRVDTAAAMHDALDGPVRWDVVLADYSMPTFNAPQALAVLKGSGRDVPMIVVSGSVGEDVVVAVMRQGAADYIMKDSLARLAPAVEREVGRTHRGLGEGLDAALDAIARALDAGDGTPAGRSPRLAELAGAAARAMGMDSAGVADVRRAALLRQIANPEGVHHAAACAALLGEIPFLGKAAALAASAAEHWDGTGRPAGLTGTAIPAGARILAVVEAYIHAAGAESGGSGSDPALVAVRAASGTCFDPVAVKALATALAA